MKNLILGVFTALALFSCNKESIPAQQQEVNNTITSSMAKIKSGGGTFVTAELHRTKGLTRRMTANRPAGVPCDCVWCFGICDVSFFGSKVVSSNLIFEATYDKDDTKGRIFLMEQPSIEEMDNNSFYIDENIEAVSDKGVVVTFKEGNYHYVAEPQTVEVEGEDFFTYGYVIIDIEQ